MNIPVEIIAIFVGVWLTLQGWTLSELVKLKTKVAVLSQRLDDAKK